MPSPPATNPALAPPWSSFSAALAATLSALKDESLVIAVKNRTHYVQFAHREADGLRAETVSNSYLTPDEHLNVTSLTTLGWSPPTHSPRSKVTQADGSPNFYRDFPSPVAFAAAADLAVRTLVDVLGAPAPDSLEYHAFDRNGRRVMLPALGLATARVEAPEPLPSEPPPRSSALRALVLSAVRELIADPEVEFDEDDDLPIPIGRRTAYLRVIDAPRLVRIRLVLAREVGDDPVVQRRVHELNVKLPLARLIVTRGAVFAAVDVSGEPFVPVHLAQACAILDSLADEVCLELRAVVELPD